MQSCSGNFSSHASQVCQALATKSHAQSCPNLSTFSCVFLPCQKNTHALGGFRKALRGFSVKGCKPHSGSFLELFGSDSGVLPSCSSDFWSVTPTFGLYEARIISRKICLRIISWGFYSEAFSFPPTACQLFCFERLILISIHMDTCEIFAGPSV